MTNSDNRAEELELERKAIQIENEDQRADAQRKMAWFSLLSMLLYPGLVLIGGFLPATRSIEILGDMAPTYFGSVAVILAAFFGAAAYKDVHK